MNNKKHKTHLLKVLSLTLTLSLLSIGAVGCNTEELKENISILQSMMAESSEENSSTSEQSTSSSVEKIKINPFEGISYTVSGISPYCTLSVNNAGCSEDAQTCVTYTFDKTEYKNGDVATVTAEFIQEIFAEEYELTLSTSSYTVENQAEYLTSLDGVDTAVIQAELADFMLAKEGSAGWWTTGSEILFMDIIFRGEFEEVDLHNFSLELQNTTYFSCLKAHNRGDKEKDFNILSFLCKIKFKGSDTGYYVCISAENIVKKADGSLIWSSEKDMDKLDFVASNTQGSFDASVKKLVMCNNIEYNIFTIENQD